jgi:c-di-GMP-related signal transduction protein
MTEDIFLSRQPIFDRNERVWGYALLANADLNSFAGPMDGNEATRPHAEYLSMVLEKLAAGRKVLVNVSDGFFLNEDSLRLPKEMVVLEISQEVSVDDGLRAACRHLKEQGHVLVLGDLVRPIDTSHPLVEMVDILRIDYQQASPADWQEGFTQTTNLKFLANRIESRTDFRQAVNQGFHYLQGRFFSRPEIISRSEIPRYKLNFVKLLNELGRTRLDFLKLQKLLEGNPTLIHKLLSYINSAFFGLNCQVASVHQALLLLGEQEIRKWAALAIIHHLGQDQPEELLRLSLLRAHFSEILAIKIGLGPQGSELFLVGLLSLMDVYLGRPLAEVVTGMPLAPLIKETLLGGATPYRQVFDLVLANEKANWEQVSTLTEKLNLPKSEVFPSYLEAVDGVGKAIQSWSQ